MNYFLDVTGPHSASGSLPFEIYLIIHIIAVFVGVFLLFSTMRAKTSKAQTAVVMFDLGAIIYSIGFVQEILADTAEGGFIACITQYLGEFVVFIAAVFFVSQLCSMRLPVSIYIAMVAVSSGFMMALISTRTTGFFYKKIGINREGLFSRPDLTHNFIFFAVFAYFFICSSWMLYACISNYKEASVLQKKRLALIMFSCFFCWLPWILTLSGLTGGFEIPALGITLAGVCIYLCFIKYGFFDSQSLAGSNAMERGKDGIIVTDSKYRLKYQNHKIFEIFDVILDNQNLMEHSILGDVFKGITKTYERDGKIYEFYIEPITEVGTVVAYMLWVNDATEHYEAIKRVQIAATHDSLTGLYNRTKFQSLVEDELNAHKPGTFVIFDMDNFKGVNDNYGHQVGDAVLKAFATVLKKYGEQRLYSCRLGGDEFCIFLRNVTGRKEVSAILGRIISSFADELTSLGYGGYTSLSAGAAIDITETSYKILYNKADDQLYTAKTSGKNQFFIVD